VNLLTLTIDLSLFNLYINITSQNSLQLYLFYYMWFMTFQWIDHGLAGLFVTLTLLHLGEDIKYLSMSSFWQHCQGGKLLYRLYILLSFIFLLTFFFYTCMKVWSRILSCRVCKKSSSSSENMAEEDNQTLHNENNHVRTFRDHMNPTRTSAPSCIVFSPDASHFNFKPGIIQLLPIFHGLNPENPDLHLR